MIIRLSIWLSVVYGFWRKNMIPLAHFMFFGKAYGMVIE